MNPLRLSSKKSSIYVNVNVYWTNYRNHNRVKMYKNSLNFSLFDNGIKFCKINCQNTTSSRTCNMWTTIRLCVSHCRNIGLVFACIWEAATTSRRGLREGPSRPNESYSQNAAWRTVPSPAQTTKLALYGLFPNEQIPWRHFLERRLPNTPWMALGNQGTMGGVSRRPTGTHEPTTDSRDVQREAADDRTLGTEVPKARCN